MLFIRSEAGRGEETFERESTYLPSPSTKRNDRVGEQLSWLDWLVSFAFLDIRSFSFSLLAYWSSLLSTWVLDWEAKLSYFTSYLDWIYFLLRTLDFWTPLSTRWGLRYSTRSTDPLLSFPIKLLEHFLLYLEFFYPDHSFTFPLNTELAVILHISLTIRDFYFLWTETKLLAHCLRTSP